MLFFLIYGVDIANSNYHSRLRLLLASNSPFLVSLGPQSVSYRPSSLIAFRKVANECRDNCSFIMSDQPFRSLFGFTKDSESSSSAPVAPAPNAAVGSNDPSAVEGASSAPAPSDPIVEDAVELSPPSNRRVAVEIPVVRDPPGGPHAENASEARPAGSRVSFADQPVTVEPDVPAPSEWCRRCVRLIGRDPSKAGPDFVCTRREHDPCRYCVRQTHQGCVSIPPQYTDLAANVIQRFREWASASVEDAPQAREALRRHYMVFHRTVQEPNLPEGQRQPARARRSRRAPSRGVSRGASSERSRSPAASASASRRRSPAPSAPRHVRSSSGSSLDNASEGIRIIEVLVNELQEEQITGVSRSSRTSLWGFARDFYRYVSPFSRFRAFLC